MTVGEESNKIDKDIPNIHKKKKKRDNDIPNQSSNLHYWGRFLR